MGYASRPINTGYYAIVAQREGEIMGLLEDGTKKAAEIPMPFGGRVLLTLYWWAWKIFGPGHDWSKYDGTIRALNTPIKAMSWIFANITYTSDKDPEDDWQSAQRTFKRRRGDCLPYDILIPFIPDKTGLLELKPIGEIVEEKIPGAVPSYSFEKNLIEFKPILSYQKKGRKKVFKITLKNGRDIEATENHRFFTMNEKNGLPSEIFVKDIKKDSCLFGVSGCPSLNIPYKYSPELLWVDGLYIAERWYSGKEGCFGKLAIGNKDRSILSKVMNILLRNNIPFNFYDREELKNGTPTITIKKSWYKDHLAKIGRGGCQLKHFLPEHLSLPPEQIEILLDGYRDGDGYKNIHHRVDNTEYIYTTTSPLLIKQLSFLHNVLRRPLHIEYYKSPNRDKPIWRGYYNPNSDFTKVASMPYEFILKRAKEVYSKIGTGSGGLHDSSVHSPQILNFKTMKKDGIKNLMDVYGIDLSELSWSLKDNIEWFKVKSVENIKEKETYDIEVEDNHNFLLWNDILAHNCEDWAIFACECLKKKYDCVYLCMYNKDSGHCELLIDDGMSGSDNKWISLGTYGYNHHKGKDYSRIIPDWPEYEDWTDYCVKDVNFKVIKSGKRN